MIDGWNVTTTDTAIAFRKINRGSLELSFNSWKQFLQELSTRRGLCLQEVKKKVYIIENYEEDFFILQLVDRLGMCSGPPNKSLF